MNLAEHIGVFQQRESQPPPAVDRLMLPLWAETDWNRLLSRTRPRAVRASEVVIQRGAPDRTLFFVAAGLFEVGITQVDGVSISPLARIGAGSVIGEQSFFDGLPRSANVWAVAECELLTLDYSEFERFSRDEPVLTRDLVIALARVLSLRLRNTTFRVRR